MDWRGRKIFFTEPFYGGEAKVDNTLSISVSEVNAGDGDKRDVFCVNGVSCPKCGVELAWHRDDNYMKCKCGWEGLIVIEAYKCPEPDTDSHKGD